MKLTLREIADQVNGRLLGDPTILIKGVSEIQNGKIHTITFLSNPLYNKYFNHTKASAIIVSEKSKLVPKTGILVKNPQLALAITLGLFYGKREKLKPNIDVSAKIFEDANIGRNINIGSGVVIEKDAIVGDNCSIGPNTFIGRGTRIGNDSLIYPNVTIYHGLDIGRKVTIHSGTSIGCDGFGYVTDGAVHKKIPQTGNVIIGDDVEIGSNCSVDRATIGSTVIKDMTKIDNNVHIAHNVKIGRGCFLTAGFAIAGSSEVGDFCSFGGQVGVGPHLTIGEKSIVAAKSGVTKSLKGNNAYSGIPAREIKKHNRKMALINQIDLMRKKIDQINKVIK